MRVAHFLSFTSCLSPVSYCFATVPSLDNVILLLFAISGRCWRPAAGGRRSSPAARSVHHRGPRWVFLCLLLLRVFEEYDAASCADQWLSLHVCSSFASFHHDPFLLLLQVSPSSWSSCPEWRWRACSRRTMTWSSPLLSPRYAVNLRLCMLVYAGVCCIF